MYYNKRDLQVKCDNWSNLCALLARCVQSGLLYRCIDSWWYPLCDIPEGLQEDHPVEIIDKCFLTVATQYILLAGPKIYDELVEMPWQGSSRQERVEMWLHWDKRLKEIADGEDTGSELGCTARKAHEKMRSVRYEATGVVHEPEREARIASSGGGRWFGLAGVFGGWLKPARGD